MTTQEAPAPSQEISMLQAWALVIVTREQANAYFHRLANQFESDTEIRQAFLKAADAVMIVPFDGN